MVQTKSGGDSTAPMRTERVPSSPFRKFVISYSRLFEHGNLRYREQSRDEFSRPFGKEAPHANAYCSPHHFTAKHPYGSANVSPSPFHTTIPGLTCPHCLKICRLGQADQPQNRPRIGLFQSDRGQMATALPGLGHTRSARRDAFRASTGDHPTHPCTGYLGGQHATPRPGSPCHPLDLG